MADCEVPNWAKGRCEVAWREYARVQKEAAALVKRLKLSERDSREVMMLATHGWVQGQNSVKEIHESALERGGLAALVKEDIDISWPFIKPLKDALALSEARGDGGSAVLNVVKKIVEMW